MTRTKAFFLALGLFVVALVVLLAGRELFSASASFPTGVAKNSRAKAFEIKAKFTENVWIDDVLEIPRFNDWNYSLVDDQGNTDRVIVSSLDKTADDWHKCKIGDRVKLEVQDFPVILLGQDPSRRESLAYFLKPTCARPSAVIR